MKKNTYHGRRTSSNWGIASRLKSISTCPFDSVSINLTASVRAWAGFSYFSVLSMKIWNKRWLKILIIGATSTKAIYGTSYTSSSRPSNTTKKGKNPWVVYASKMCSFSMMEHSRSSPRTSFPIRISQAPSMLNSVKKILCRDIGGASSLSPFGSFLKFIWTIYCWSNLSLCRRTPASCSLLW